LYGQCRSHWYFPYPSYTDDDDIDEIACCEILELDIPHEDHIKCIIWIRLVLDPDQPIEDYDDVSLVRCGSM